MTEASDALAGFFTEVAELIEGAQTALLAVEASVREGDLDVPSLYQVFRAMHTAKGLSAMVQAEASVALAHGLESVLQTLHKEEKAPSRELLDLLFEGATLFERTVEHLRSPDAPLPDVQGFLGRLTSCPDAGPGGGPGPTQDDLPIPEPIGQRLSGYERRKLARRLAAGEGLYVLELIPDKEKIAQGVSINTVRALLEEQGELVGAAPVVEPGKGMRFLLAVATRRPLEAVLEPWQGAVTGEARSTPAEAGTPETTPSPPPGGAPGPSPTPRPGESVVRVPVGKLDEILRLVGDLVTEKNRMTRLIDDLREGTNLRRVRAEFQECGRGLDLAVRSLRHQVMGARMVPVGELLQRVPLIVRDVCRVQHKEVRVHLTGEATEVDKAVVERLSEPLVHLVRNAVDHGIEPPQERTRVGKPAEGRLEIDCTTDGDNVVLSLGDDGRGIDRRAVARKAAGTLPPLAPEAEPSDEQLVRILCAPGFTTHEGADEVGGRGVGMEAVLRGVEALGGSLAVASEQGAGTTWTLRLPLTLTIVDVTVIRVGDDRFALPLAGVIEVLEAPEILRVEQDAVMRHRDREIPYTPLAAFVGGDPRVDDFPAAVVVRGATGPLALGVGRVLGIREVVVRPLRDPLIRKPGIRALTDLGDGKGVLILDPAELVTHRRNSR